MNNPGTINAQNYVNASPKKVGDLGSRYWNTQDKDFHATSRSGLFLVDEKGNNAPILPAVAQFNTSGNAYLTLANTITFVSGVIEMYAGQPTPTTTGGLIWSNTGGTDYVQINTATSIRIRFSSTIKTFSFSAGQISLTGLNVIRLVVTADTTTKVRCYCNGVESSSGLQDMAALKNLVLNRLCQSNGVSQLAYIKIINQGINVLEMHPTGLNYKYEYDVSENANHGTWFAAPTTVYMANGSSYLLDNGFAIYEKANSPDVYIPTGFSANYFTALNYQLRETISGSLTKYNLAPSLVQFTGASFDRSDTTIWSNSARAGYYDATSAVTKKRWHSSELHQENFHYWANENYQDILFSKFDNNTYETGRMMTELASMSEAKTGAVRINLYKYTGYKARVRSFTFQFIVNTILGQLDWVDDESGAATYEIWSSTNGRASRLVAITSAGAITYNDTTCKQNGRVKYAIRSLKNGVYGAWSYAALFNTPLCWKTDQSTLNDIVCTITFLKVTGKSVTFNWGDDTTTVISDTYNVDVTKQYTVPGIYNIWLTGDIDNIITFDYYDKPTSYGDITNWIVPWECIQFHPYKCGFTGDISDHINWFSPNLLVYDLQYLPVHGDVTSWRLGNTNIYDIHFEYTNVTGDITNWTFRSEPTTSDSAKVTVGRSALRGVLNNWALFDGVNWLYFTGGDFDIDLSVFDIPDSCTSIQINDSVTYTNRITGDISNFVFPTDDGSYALSLKFWHGELFGDMSNCLLPELSKAGSVQFAYNQITKMPRGHFKWLLNFDFSYNQCNSSEIDAFLAYVDNYFTGAVVPLTDATYLINGTGMGVPSAAGLTSRTNIINKYTAAGKTCTIAVNS
jgi:hypothetical protein